MIARVQGAAFGGGVGLVAACDIALGTAQASFCLSEVKLGIMPAMISPYLVARIGPGAARRYSLTAERFDAATAQRLGLLAEVYPDEAALDAGLGDLCARLKQNGPAALAACKGLYDAVAGTPAALRAETQRRIAEIRVSPKARRASRPSWRSGRRPGKGTEHVQEGPDRQSR